MRMEMLDIIYHQLFFTANSLGRQPTASQYFQLLTPWTLVLAAAAIHCTLSEYASRKKATVMLSQDEYQGTFCPSPMINFTPKASALINHTLVGRLIPHVVQLREDRRSSIPVGPPEPRLTLLYLIPHWIPLSTLLISRRRSLAKIDTLLFHSTLNSPPLSALHNSHRRTSVWIVVSILNCALLTPTTPTPPRLAMVLRMYRRTSIPVGAPQPRFGTPQSPSVLLSLDLALLFILRSFNTFCVLLSSTQHSPSGAPLFLGGCSPFSSE